MPSPAEELTRRFYEWERRGRGWLQWPRPVAVEPPFRPFYGHFLLPPTGTRDDGRTETIFSRLAKLFGPRNVAPAPPYELPEELFAEPEPVFVTEDEEFIELAVALPEGTRVEHEAAEGFLMSLAACRNPVAFEIVGSGERIVLQFTARRSDAAHVHEALRAFFPAVGVAETQDVLFESWRDAGERVRR